MRRVLRQHIRHKTVCLTGEREVSHKPTFLRQSKRVGAEEVQVADFSQKRGSSRKLSVSLFAVVRVVVEEGPEYVGGGRPRKFMP